MIVYADAGTCWYKGKLADLIKKSDKPWFPNRYGDPSVEKYFSRVIEDPNFYLVMISQRLVPDGMHNYDLMLSVQGTIRDNVTRIYEETKNGLNLNLTRCDKRFVHLLEINPVLFMQQIYALGKLERILKAQDN
jgi:hypothetical protein